MGNAFSGWIKQLFIQHPKSVGETYFGHMKSGAFYGLMLTIAGVACFVHCVLPFLFQTTGSHLVEKVYADMKARQNKSSFLK